MSSTNTHRGYVPSPEQIRSECEKIRKEWPLSRWLSEASTRLPRVHRCSLRNVRRSETA
jgi:hypothetical protein